MCSGGRAAGSNHCKTTAFVLAENGRYKGGKERNEKEEMMAEKMRKGGKVKGRIDIREESAVFGLIEKERGKGQKGD